MFWFIRSMKIQNNTQNTSFGQLVPTKPLLKSALKIHNFEEGRELYLSTSTAFPGNVGYYKKAIEIAQNAVKKNENIKNIIDKLKITPKNELPTALNDAINTLGKNVDINI